MLGSAQLAGSHRGKWSPEAAGEALCPGELGEQDPSLFSEQGEAGLAGMVVTRFTQNEQFLAGNFKVSVSPGGMTGGRGGEAAKPSFT